MFIEIVTPDQTFEHVITRDAAGTVAAGLTLRVIDEERERAIRRANTGKARFERGQRFEPFDAAGFIADVIDYAITAWTGVRSQGRDLPCTREFKLLLPEAIKTDVIRLCLGKEAGETVADEKKS
jgi:hypothetical protein